jgi:hypothetical protein
LGWRQPHHHISTFPHLHISTLAACGSHISTSSHLHISTLAACGILHRQKLKNSIFAKKILHHPETTGQSHHSNE